MQELQLSTSEALVRTEVSQWEVLLDGNAVTGQVQGVKEAHRSIQPSSEGLEASE